MKATAFVFIIGLLIAAIGTVYVGFINQKSGSVTTITEVSTVSNNVTLTLFLPTTVYNTQTLTKTDTVTTTVSNTVYIDNNPNTTTVTQTVTSYNHTVAAGCVNNAENWVIEGNYTGTVCLVFGTWKIVNWTSFPIANNLNGRWLSLLTTED